MTQFDDREKAEERRFASKEEFEFKVAARRDKLLGLWVASKLGLEGDAAEKYATSVIVADLEEKGDEDVFRKVFADLQKANSDVSEHVVRREMETLLDQARAELKQ